jgi:hypothetical protein
MVLIVYEFDALAQFIKLIINQFQSYFLFFKFVSIFQDNIFSII